MKVYLLRHGQTDWNVAKRWQGSTDIQLNDIGVKQAEEAATRFVDTKISSIYTSHLGRAINTAEVIRNIAFDKSVEINIENDIAEIRLGEWEGLTYSEVEEKYSDDYKRWVINHTEVIGYGVENYNDLQQRAFNVFSKICSENSEDLLIVSHGAWIRALVCKILCIPLEHRDNFEIENTSITIIEVIKDEENRTANKFILKTLNDTNHV